MNSLRFKIREDLIDIEIERNIKSRVIREMDDITLVCKALTDNYYDSASNLYLKEIKRRIKSNKYTDIQDYFIKTLDGVFGKEEYYSYGAKLQKKRIPEL